MSQSTAESIQVVTFTLVNQINKKSEDYALPIKNVKEIRTLEEITEVPKAKSYVKGIMNLRGLIIPVVDVKDKLGFGKTLVNKKSKQRILVAEVNDSLYGLLVDDVDQVMRIESKDIGPIPSDTFESYGYVTGIAKIKNRLIVLLDAAPLINDCQDETIQDIQSDQQFDTNEKPTIDDIPDELKAVFEEDSEGIQPTEIIRE